jgi:hypothetical protein
MATNPASKHKQMLSSTFTRPVKQAARTSERKEMLYPDFIARWFGLQRGAKNFVSMHLLHL